MPHVRLSVRGPKKIGVARRSLLHRLADDPVPEGRLKVGRSPGLTTEQTGQSRKGRLKAVSEIQLSRTLQLSNSPR